MTDTTAASVRDRSSHSLGVILKLLINDKWALASALYLLVIVLTAIVGPWFLSRPAVAMNLAMRNHPPFSLDNGFLLVLGADTLGRSILARLIVGSQNTLLVAGAAVAISMIVGGALGIFAGYRRGWLSTVILRVVDVVMSFPSLLLALVVLYALGTSIVNVIMILAITRIPLYVRTSCAEVLEIRERLYVTAAFVLGARPRRLIWRHIAPAVTPTLITLATLDFAAVMLAESSLSYLGLGIQPPSISWGVMVSEGQSYLSTAWWVAFWPGLAITLTTLALNLLAGWVRIAADPVQRWRLETANV